MSPGCPTKLIAGGISALFPESCPGWQGSFNPTMSRAERGQCHGCHAAREQGWPRRAARPSAFCQ